MSTGLVVFLFVIVLAAMVAACAVTVYLERNFPSEKFDERQKIARGNAYRFSHGVGLIYYFGLMVYFTIHTGKTEWPAEPFLLVFIGILLQLQSFHIYCVMSHSALPLGEKPTPTIISYFILGSMWLAMCFVQHIPVDAAAAAGYTGAGSFNLFRLLIALDFYALAGLHLISLLRKEKE